MSETNGKLFFIGKIFLMLIFCTIVSLVVGFFSIIYVFGIGDCVLEECKSSAFNNFTAWLALLSPFLIFSVGAYFCRSDVNALTEVTLMRLIILLSIALFPIYLPAGLIVYAAVSR